MPVHGGIHLLFARLTVLTICDKLVVTCAICRADAGRLRLWPISSCELSMPDLPLPALSDTRVLTRETIGSESLPSSGSESSTLPDLLDVLRQAITTREQSTDSILMAIADSAWVASGADGVAIASRMNGVIVCRARAGEIAPVIGTPLSSDSGISGACLRTGNTLVCCDALTDPQVDADVCRKLGIRSIVVVPLRDDAGVLGILEAFSTRASAFAQEQLRFLRALAEIAEMAYDSETAHSPSSPEIQPATIGVAAALSLPSSADEPGQSKAAIDWTGKFTRYWPAGAAVLALVLIVLVIRLSWRQAGAEIASSAAGSAPAITSQSGKAVVPAETVSLKPAAAVQAQQLKTGAHKNPLKNAAEIEPALPPSSSESTPVRVLSDAPITSKNAATTDTDAPPMVELAKSGDPGSIVTLPMGSQPMPQFGAPVSQGVVQPVLIQKVSPIYPAQARVQGLTGSVVLDAVISAQGSVRKVKVVSGPPVLAAAATAAVREWRYVPGILDGKAVETQQRITVVFKLP